MIRQRTPHHMRTALTKCIITVATSNLIFVVLCRCQRHTSESLKESSAIAGLAPECAASIHKLSIFTSLIDVPFWFVVILGKWIDPLLPADFHSSAVRTLVDGLGFMLQMRILLLSELVSMPHPAAIFSELLEFFFTASQQINVISKPHVAKRSFSGGHFL